MGLITAPDRVSDAAPTIGVAAWWHGWEAAQLDELAGAWIAGHLIERSAFITALYYSRLRELMKTKEHLNLGFPIAEVLYITTASVLSPRKRIPTAWSTSRLSPRSWFGCAFLVVL